MDNGVPNFLEYPQMNYSPLTAVQDSFFSSTTRGLMANPPLPEFNGRRRIRGAYPHGH
jgi:hypothetical protein